MTTLAMLCALWPDYGCLPMRSLDECWEAHERLSEVVILSSCEEAEYDIDIRGVMFAPLPPKKPEGRL